MIRNSLPYYLFAGYVVLAVAAPAAAQCNPCSTPTVAYSPVPVQAYQPVVVEQRRSCCCLGWLCDWIWGRDSTVVAAAPAPVPQTYAYPPCPPAGCDPCSACGASPCCCPSAGTASPGGAPSTFAPAYSGYRGPQYGGDATYTRYAATPAPQSTYRTANSIQGGNVQPNLLNGARVQLTSFQVPHGTVQPAAYQVPVAGAYTRMATSPQTTTWNSVPPPQTTGSRLRVQ